MHRSVFHRVYSLLGKRYGILMFRLMWIGTETCSWVRYSCLATYSTWRIFLQQPACCSLLFDETESKAFRCRLFCRCQQQNQPTSCSGRAVWHVVACMQGKAQTRHAVFSRLPCYLRLVLALALRYVGVFKTFACANLQILPKITVWQQIQNGNGNGHGLPNALAKVPLSSATWRGDDS